MNYIIEYDIAAIIITLTIVVSFFRKKIISTKLSRGFTIIVSLHLSSTVFDLVSVFTIENSKFIPVWLNYLFNIIYFILLCGVAIAFLNIIFFTIEEKKRKNIKLRRLVYIPYFVESILVILTPINKWIFYFDNNNIYTIGKYFDIVYVISLIYLVFSLVVVYKERIYLSKSQIFTIFFYLFAICISVYLQYNNTKLLVINFVTAISLLLIYLSLENPANYTDKEMEIFNRAAFLIVSNQKILNKKRFRIIGFQINGLKYLNETIGIVNKNQLLKKISDNLNAVCNKHYLFRISRSKIVLIIPDDEKLQNQLIEKIKKIFSESIKIEDFKLTMSVRFTILICPDSANDVDDAIDLIENMLNNMDDKENGTVLPADRKLLLKTNREHKIELILKNAIQKNEFFIVYQPIFSVEKRKFTTAEALIRLHNEELGFIGPDEFIPIAEKCGIILEIGEYVFKNVCEFIITEKIWEKGIDYIHVNLSVIQCMQTKLHDELLKIMDSYNLDYKFINLEVTETTAIASRETLKGNMSKLIDKNISFSLDDFGTGFSNMSTLIEYPFESIKLDKSIIDAAEKDFKAKIILINTIKMLKELKLVIIAEGVETKEQANKLTEMGCDYIQGYYFSKPIPKEDFLELLK